jgi:hypothetical protein
MRKGMKILVLLGVAGCGGEQATMNNHVGPTGGNGGAGSGG